MLCKIIFLFVCLFTTQALIARTKIQSTQYPIAGLFNGLSQASSVKAFENIIQVTGTRIYHGRILNSELVDSYSLASELCPFTSDDKSVVALIDVRPTFGICDTVCLLCNKYNITHLSVGWQPTDTMTEDIFTFSYYPPPELISKAFTALIKYLQWDKFTIFYETDESFYRLQDVINSWTSPTEAIIFRKLDPKGDNREIFKDIFKVQHMSYHIIDCDIENVITYFHEITQVDNSTEYQSFILSNLDAYKLNLDRVPDLMANVSTLHITAPNDEKWRDTGFENGSAVQLETALTADAINHLEKAIIKMQSMGDEFLHDVEEPPALCYQDTKSEYEELAWPLGDKLREAIQSTKHTGFTGHIDFDENGRRTNLLLHYSKLNKDSQFVYAGKWESRTNIISMENEIEARSTAMKSNSKIKIASKDGLPYFTIKETEDGPLYRGYAVDLVTEIFEVIELKKKLKFEYEFYRVDGDKTGNPIGGTKKWDGIIGDLIEHKADMGVCDITITSDRNEVVDFSIPFMSLGISLLMRKPIPEPPHMFSFLLPLSLDVWLYLGTTYIIVSFILLICARMSQDDWVNPHPCNQNPDSYQNIWSLYNCMWLTMGAIMCQGCDILPRAIGSRWIAGVWWFFALIVTSSYTANMSTFISDNRRSNDIKDVNDLAQQNKISYGALLNGSTYKFFQNTNDSTYAKLWAAMESAKPTVFTKTNEEGTNRVNRSKGKYAFFMESTGIEYAIKRNCDLKMVGSKLDSKEYGIAMAKNFPRKGLVDFAILSLQESGRLEELKKKWWEIEDNESQCSVDEKVEDDNGSLQMKNTSGIFLVLGVGGIVGLLVAVVDFMLHARQISVIERVTFKEALLSEWRASLNPKDLHKSVAPPRSEPTSSGSPSPQRERSHSRAVSVLRAASSFINFDEIY